MNPFELTIEEVEARRILTIRTAVLRPHFPASRLAHFPGDDDETTHHFAALGPRSGGGQSEEPEVLAIVSYYQSTLKVDGSEEPAVQLRGMAVASSFQRQGIGGHLLTTTLGRLPILYPTARWVWCNARQSAISFYQNHGFEVFGDPFTLPEIGPHRRMRRKIPIAIAS